MSETILEQRKRWYRHFPESSLEFLVATRVLATALLLALVVMREAQRPIVLTGLVGVLWLDYVLMLWWSIQVAGDLAVIEGQATSALLPEKRWLLGVTACLPSSAAAVGLAPWPAVAVLRTRVAGSWSVQEVGALVAFIVLSVAAMGAMRRVGLGRGVWTALALVPGLHWFSLQRIVAGLDERIGRQHRERRPSETDHYSRAARAAADVTWVLCAVPWAAVIAVSAAKGWPDALPASVLPFCGIGAGVLFGVANLAALERVQRHFVRLIRDA